MKSIPKTLKPKKRYIAFKVHSDIEISKKNLIEEITKTTLGFFGERLFSDLGLWIQDYDTKRKKGFLICNLTFKSEIITSLTLVNSIGGEAASIQVLGVSGTIKALKRKFLNDRSDMSQEKGENKNATNS
jgi:ribonuclease P/MRP protein subunit POP5